MNSMSSEALSKCMKRVPSGPYSKGNEYLIVLGAFPELDTALVFGLWLLSTG